MYEKLMMVMSELILKKKWYNNSYVLILVGTLQKYMQNYSFTKYLTYWIIFFLL